MKRLSQIGRRGRGLKWLAVSLALASGSLTSTLRTIAGSETSAGEALSSESEAAVSTRTILPPRFRPFETNRFVVFSDTDTAWTRQQIQYLEMAHHQFLRFCHRLEIAPAPLRHKLVAVIFDRRADYRRFAQEEDGVGDASLAGYYAPRTDRVVFYNIQSNPSLTVAHEKLDAMAADIEAIERRIRDAEREGRSEQARNLRKLRGNYQDHLKRQRARVSTFATQAATATIVHEAIHQLLFHTGVQSRQIEYPIWISEGLATAFETESPGQAFGPDHEFEPRRTRFQTLLAEEHLLPLEILIGHTSHNGGETDHDVVYHQSYALVTWMSRFRRHELRQYLEAMRREPPGHTTPERQRELFESSFGDVGELERAWLRHEGG